MCMQHQTVPEVQEQVCPGAGTFGSPGGEDRPRAGECLGMSSLAMALGAPGRTLTAWSGAARITYYCAEGGTERVAVLHPVTLSPTRSAQHRRRRS